MRAVGLALCLLLVASATAWAASAARPPGPAPRVKGVKDGPPPAWVETSSGAKWLAFSSYCWKTTCADFIPQHCEDKGTPTILVNRGETVRFHLGFRPKSATVSFARGKPKPLRARSATSWRVTQGGFFSLMVYVRVGEANFDASYIGCIRLR
jgi:hypothetical protein